MPERFLAKSTALRYNKKRKSAMKKADQLGTEEPLLLMFALVSTPLLAGVWVRQTVHTYRQWKAGEQDQN